MTPPTFRQLLALMPALFVSFITSAQSVSELPLSEVLELSYQRTMQLSDEALGQGYQSSSWLASLPSISVNVLKSDQDWGSDEREISLNLPMKSMGQRRADNKLKQLSESYEKSSILRRKLYLSGLIREALWSHQLAQVQLQSVIEKHQVLQQLEAQYQQLFLASSISEYALLLVQKELVVAEIEQHNSAQEVRRWRTQFRAITGLGGLPTTIMEADAPQKALLLQEHPELRFLELGWLQTQQVLLASSNQAAPWDVSLTALNIRAGGLEEDQYGIGVEIPLSFIKIATQSNNSQWLQANRNFEIARDKLRLGIQSRWDRLRGTGELLLKQNKLLTRASSLSAAIAKQAQELREFNELAEEVILRQMIEAINTGAAVTLNQTRIQQNNAMLRQAAGIPL